MQEFGGMKIHTFLRKSNVTAQSVNVWCGLWRDIVIEPLWFGKFQGCYIRGTRGPMYRNLFQSNEGKHFVQKFTNFHSPVLHLAERKYVAGNTAVHIRLKYEGEYLLLSSFLQRKVIQKLLRKGRTTHINICTVTFDFPSNVWVFTSPKLCIFVC